MANTYVRLERALRGYLQQVDSEFQAEGEDLINIAANNARKFAEKSHSWSFTEVYAYVTANPTASWAVAKLVEDDSDVSLRQVQNYYLHDAAQDWDVPLRFATKRHFADRARERLDAQHRTDITRRYPGDPTGTLESGARPEISILGAKFEVVPNPSSAVEIRLDALMWLPDYSADGDTDYFLEHGFDYMLYGSLVELNKLTKTFVPREEGNLPEPVKERDEALEALVKHDLMLVEEYREPVKR